MCVYVRVCVCVCALLLSLLTNENLAARLPLCVCVCVILLLHQSPWMPATHRAISHKFSQPCKHNIYLSATLSGLLYVAPKKSSEKWSCCLRFILYFRCPCRRPRVGRGSCQTDHWGGTGREGGGETVQIQLESISTPTCTSRVHSSFYPHCIASAGRETCWKSGYMCHIL